MSIFHFGMEEYMLIFFTPKGDMYARSKLQPLPVFPLLSFDFSLHASSSHY